jgi:hypothetical protein
MVTKIGLYLYSISSFTSSLKPLIMEMTSIQVLVFAQSLVLKVRNPDWELTRNAVSYRSQYKEARGLGRNANALAVLRDLKSVCEENPAFLEPFNKATERYPEVLARL